MCFSPQLAASELVGYGDGRDRGAEAGTGLGRRGTVLPASSGAGADRHGSHRQLSLAGGFAGRVGPRAVGGRCGADSCQLRAAAEDGQARCGAYSEAAGRGAVSEDLDAVECSARPAATAVASLQAGDHAGAGEEGTATPLPEERSPWRAE